MGFAFILWYKAAGTQTFKGCGTLAVKVWPLWVGGLPDEKGDKAAG